MHTEPNTPALVTVPRAALQALAEWAYPLFAHDRINAKLPAQHPRWTSWNIHDDLQVELERERMAFLKEIFWKAEQEAARRERAADPARGYGGSSSLELFMECVAEMDAPGWDEPMTPKELAERKKKIRAKNAEKEAAREMMARLDQEREHPTPESAASLMGHLRDVSLFTIKENLASEDPEIRAKAQEEIQHLTAGLQDLLAPHPEELVEVGA